MPIDPRIALGGQPVQIQSPLEALQTVAQLQGVREQTEARRLAADEARQKAQDAAAIRQVLAETGGDMTLALPRLRQIAPLAALTMETEIQKAQKEKFETATHQMTARTKGLDFAATMAALVAQNPATASAVRSHLQGISEEIRPLLPETDDPVAWQQFADLALTAKDRYEKSQSNLKLFGEGKLQEALVGALSTASNAEEWDAHIKGFLELGGPQPIAQMFGDYSPEHVARAAQLAITPTKRAELAGQDAARAGQAEGRAQTAAHQGVLEQQGAQRVAIAQAGERRQAAAQSVAGGTLPPRQETTVRGLGTAFRNESAVKRTTTMAEAVNFVSGLSSTTKNPADDQGLIYAFAKAMDPESVVREGEYATVQKYATSWLERFGFDARRVLSSDTPILTAAARDNLKATITSRYQASRTQYDNLVKSYTAQINKATGRTDGAERLTDYASAFPDAEDEEGATTSSPGRGGLTYQDYLRSKGK